MAVFQCGIKNPLDRLQMLMPFTRGQYYFGQVRDVFEAFLELMCVQRAHLIIGNDNNAPIADKGVPSVGVLKKASSDFDGVAPIADRRTQVDVNDVVSLRHE